MSKVQPNNNALSLRGTLWLAAIAWILFSAAIIATVSRLGLSRPLGAYGGSCLGSTGDNCMAALVRHQQWDDVLFLLATFLAAAIPAGILAWASYQSGFRLKTIIKWGCLGTLGMALGITVSPVAYALFTLNSNPALALQTAKFVRSGPSFVNEFPIHLLDRRVLDASNRIIASDDLAAQNALAEYAGSGQAGENWRDILLKLANKTPANEQALICLAWHGDPRNLQLLGDKLLTNDAAAQTIPYELVMQYGKQGESYVKRCLKESPNMRVRFSCARELVLKGAPEGFEFYLDNLSWNKGQMRSQILQEMKDYIRGGRYLNDKQLPTFLAEHAKAKSSN
jgi:hypothetical protein